MVDLELCLGNVKRTVEVNLTDRSSFNYPLLIGDAAVGMHPVTAHGFNFGLAGAVRVWLVGWLAARSSVPKLLVLVY